MIIFMIISASLRIIINHNPHHHTNKNELNDTIDAMVLAHLPGYSDSTADTEANSGNEVQEKNVQVFFFFRKKLNFSKKNFTKRKLK